VAIAANNVRLVVTCPLEGLICEEGGVNGRMMKLDQTSPLSSLSLLQIAV